MGDSDQSDRRRRWLDRFGESTGLIAIAAAIALVGVLIAQCSDRTPEFEAPKQPVGARRT